VGSQGELENVGEPRSAVMRARPARLRQPAPRCPARPSVQGHVRRRPRSPGRGRCLARDRGRSSSMTKRAIYRTALTCSSPPRARHTRGRQERPPSPIRTPPPPPRRSCHQQACPPRPRRARASRPQRAARNAPSRHCDAGGDFLHGTVLSPSAEAHASTERYCLRSIVMGWQLGAKGHE